MTGKKGKSIFHGRGPFSSINLLTTRIRMIEAVERFGIGGDAAKAALRESENLEFIDGVVNAHEIAKDPNWDRV
ncbi:MAG: hypothetical protein A2288_03390 [Candidatus Moranbacteria bacterium RIFOXYA12_FULL_44_15]|nr:MAG: hypothetical protein A2288_03390 [Candidatus Moranbacteria bacterium RIFOXYA12_FULL_44_15]OGI34934.1 MAG: hypothetical protein A2259_03680 [Candidatus Moranbacteria bacterium RIFOXYA2_FULL_43_15]